MAIHIHSIKATLHSLQQLPAEGEVSSAVTLAELTFFILMGSSTNPTVCEPQNNPFEEPVSVDRDKIGGKEGTQEKQVEANWKV